MDPLDFAPLDGPLAAGEARVRRRALRGGRSAVTELSMAQWFALLFLAFAWLAAVPTVVVALGASLDWLLTRGATPDYLSGVPIITGGAALLLIGLAVLTRLALVPPRWGRWVRMQRFAEANGLVFLRRATREQLPGIADAGDDVGLLTDAFLDPHTGIVVGNAGEGVGRQGFVLVPRGTSEEGEFAPGEEPLQGFDLVPTRHGILAVRHRSVDRSSASIRRLFATADAVRRDDQAAIR